jgi:hypothetical protein
MHEINHSPTCRNAAPADQDRQAQSAGPNDAPIDAPWREYIGDRVPCTDPCRKCGSTWQSIRFRRSKTEIRCADCGHEVCFAFPAYPDLKAVFFSYGCATDEAGSSLPRQPGVGMGVQALL